MDDLISRQAAIDAAKEELDNGTFYDIPSKIEYLPPALPEVIRCKDCKHRPLDSEDTQGFGVEFPDNRCPCQCEDGWYNWRPNDDWFCAYADMRGDTE